MRKIKNILLLTTLIAGISTVNFAYGSASLTTDTEAAAASGVRSRIKDLWGIESESDDTEVIFEKDGKVQLRTSKVWHDPTEPIRQKKEVCFPLFEVSKDNAYRHLESRIRTVQKSDTEIALEYQPDTSEDVWEEIDTFIGKNPVIIRTDFYSITISFQDDRGNNSSISQNPFSCAAKHTIRERQKCYRVQSNEDIRKFTVQYNPTPQIPEAWRNIYEAEGVGAEIVTNQGEFHLRWFNKGRNIALIINDGSHTVTHEPGVWEVQYSDIHTNVKVITRRAKPGLPLIYELWEDGVLTQRFDTNITGFSDFAEVTPIYVKNTIDETLPDDVPNKRPGLYIPVSLYTRGHDLSKPTLIFIKGGPYITRHSSYYTTYNALSYDFNVAVAEYRGSGGNGIAGGDDLIEGDLGGGHNRDVISVLRAIRTRNEDFKGFNPDNITVLGHSFGGYSLATIMQDPIYESDIKGVKCILANGEFDVLAMARYSGGFNNHHHLLNDDDIVDGTSASELVGSDTEYEDTEEPMDFQEMMKGFMVKANKIKVKDNMIRSPMFHTHKMPKEKTLVIASTHDGNVPMEQSLQFVMQWARNLAGNALPPLTSALTKIGQFDACTNDSSLIAYRTSPTTREILEEFKMWWGAIDPVIRSTLPIEVSIIENASHSFTDSHEVLGEFLKAVQNFTRKHSGVK